MLHINRATLLGRAGRDPDVRTLNNGGKAATFSVATTEKWTDREGRPAEATEWHRIVVYGPAAAAVETMLRKGDPVVVEGRVATRSFRDNEGANRTITEIVVAGAQGTVSILPGRRGGPDRGEPAPDTDPGDQAESDADGTADAGSGEPVPAPGSGPGQASEPEARKMRRPRHDPAPARPIRARPGGSAVDWPGVGADLHRALRQPDHGRVLGVPVPDLDRADLHRQRLGRAGHAEPVLADLLLRLAHSAHRPLARGLGTGAPGGRVAHTLVLPEPRRAHHQSRPAGRARAHRVLRRRRRFGLGLACALLHVSALELDRRAARSRLPRRGLARHRLGLGAGSGLARRRAVVPAESRKRRCSPTCRRKRPARPTAPPPPSACRSIRCSGAPAARAGCIR